MNILIIEDSQDIQKQLTDILSAKAPVNIQTARDFERVRFLLGVYNFDLIIVDFLLPDKMNGVDIVKKLKMDQDKNGTLWFISSVVKKNHIRDIFGEKAVSNFFTKPLDKMQIETKFQDFLNNKQDNNQLYTSFYKKDVSSKDIEEIFKNQSIVNGQELALLCCLLSLSKWTGCVKLNQKNLSSSILFANGELVNVKSPHKKSYFGVLLYEQGLSDIEDIKKHLQDKNEGLIGEKLVTSGCISPHAVSLILKEQARIRTSQLISPGPHFAIQLEPSSELSENRWSLDLQDLRSILSETLWAKLDKKWLDDFISGFEEAELKKTPHQNLEHIESSWLAKLKNILSLVDNKQTILQIISKAKAQFDIDRVDAVFCIYYLLISQYLFLKRALSDVKVKDAHPKIVRMKERIKKDDYFSFLSVSKNDSPIVIKTRIDAMVKIFHPDRYLDIENTQLAPFCHEIISHINKIKDTLLNDEKRKKYIAVLERSTKEECLRILNIYNAAKDKLYKRRYKEAIDLIEKIKNLNNIPSDTILYYCWAFMKSKERFDPLLDEENVMFSLIDRVSLEEKHTSLFHFVKALYLIKKLHPVHAKKELEMCLSINPMFVHAKLELEELERKPKNRKIMSKWFKTG